MPLKTPMLASLKECMKKIDCEATEIRRTFNTMHITNEDEDKSNIYKTESRNIRKNIYQLKYDCQKLNSLLKYETNRTKSYFYDMEDLTLDVEAEIVLLEKHLAKFKYKPLSLETSCELSIIESSEVESESSDSEQSVTPELVLPRMLLEKKRIQEPPKEIIVEVSAEVSRSTTPELNICAVQGRKPRNILSSPLPYSSFDSVTKLGDVARRLEF
ncbi:uncharacterized protein TNIN_104461 [Trichonephila inaurata madagascariensis]|uniref:Uncharacterized protein n=1 Tax=Trichonephila inaurata madagascariensis TaxID=2747483 RepID=A0A8X6I7U3_9ARAC|nr:uncharacterized protein TNIN_104461 [Trichonephila inaurata madagascariensis]